MRPQLPYEGSHPSQVIANPVRPTEECCEKVYGDMCAVELLRHVWARRYDLAESRRGEKNTVITTPE